MITLLLFLVPLLSGLLLFAIKGDRGARSLALVSSFITLGLAIYAASGAVANDLSFEGRWLGTLGSSFSLSMDGMSKLLCLLTAVAYPIILIATWKSEYRRSNNFFALMLLTQAGILGVFTATDALLFYFFWELALIPMYFLCSGWGGERRIPVTFKFFIYTFAGSVLMLIGLLYLHFQTPDASFSMQSFYALQIPGKTQNWLFWLMFVAFAVKMPIFPFHTWQPDTYEQSPTAATMVLSGIMVKMGIFGLLRWVIPVLPLGSFAYSDSTMTLCVIGIVYASILAIQQDDLKRMIAYSSIAHVGLMALAIFAQTKNGLQGVMMQMFNHGINIIGLWIVVELIERQFGTRKLSMLGGIAQKAPALTIMLVIVAFANISLPLTNAFVGEFLMFNGIWSSGATRYSILFTAIAGLSIILAAVYMLTMIQRVFFGSTTTLTERPYDLYSNERIALSILVIMILVFGIYPQPLLDVTNSFVDGLLPRINVAHLFKF